MGNEMVIYKKNDLFGCKGYKLLRNKMDVLF